MKVLGCILDQHDLRLVLLAAAMCLLASLTTCALLSRATAASGRVRAAWLAAAAAEFGGGVWSLHFVAMLAYMPGASIGYAIVPTAVSAVAAITGALCAFHILLTAPGSKLAHVAATVCLTAGIASMHYTGVSAMRFAGTPELDGVGVAWSVALCLCFSWLALQAMRSLRTPVQLGCATAWLALAVCTLHFTGMLALTLRLGGGGGAGAGAIGPVELAVSLAGVSVALLSGSLALTIMDWHLSRRAAQERERLLHLLGASFEGLVVERDGAIVYVNERVCDLVGQDAASLVGRDLDWLGLGQVLSLEDGKAGPRQEHRMVHRDGSFIPVECVTRSVSYEGVQANAVAVRDPRERQESEAALTRLVHQDLLTGLPNRALLAKHLPDILSDARSHGRTVAVLCLGLDGFQSVSDLLGHNAADEMLIGIARRLERELREGDFLARPGADEFVAVMQTTAGAHEVVADRLLHALAEPFVLAGQSLTTSMSAGVALFPEHASDEAELLRCAEVALRCAKDAGGEHVCVFSPEMDADLKKRLMLERDLRQAIQDGGITLFYQPLVNAATGRIEGYEALARWHHPVLGMVPPSVFIPLAEDKQLIQPLGRFVLETACREAASWDAGQRVAVNLSAKQFQQADLTGWLFELLDHTGLPPGRLELELTESVLVDDPDHAQRMLSALRAGGIRVSLDDFGTGYSSLSYLRRFPLDKIKIDRSFIANIAGDPQSAAIVQALITLAHTLGLSVTAEGVETAEQLDELQRRSCNQVQGYLLGRPAREPLENPYVLVPGAEETSAAA